MNNVCYHCGTKAIAGDTIRFKGALATVEDVAATQEQSKAWGGDETGIVFEHPELGRLFECDTHGSWKEVEFVARA